MVSAADGLEAMKLALTSAVDIVITDAMMPNLSVTSWVGSCGTVRNFSSHPDHLLSGMERKEGSQEEGYADALFSKPVSPEDLTECVAELLLARK